MAELDPARRYAIARARYPYTRMAQNLAEAGRVKEARELANFGDFVAYGAGVGRSYGELADNTTLDAGPYTLGLLEYADSYPLIYVAKTVAQISENPTCSLRITNDPHTPEERRHVNRTHEAIYLQLGVTSQRTTLQTFEQAPEVKVFSAESTIKDVFIDEWITPKKNVILIIRNVEKPPTLDVITG